MNVCNSVLREVFYTNSIFESLDSEKIAQRKAVEKEFSVFQKMKLGIKTGATDICRNIVLMAVVDKIAMVVGVVAEEVELEPPLDIDEFFQMAFFTPIVEEIIFRGILNNALAGMQRLAVAITPDAIGQTRVFKLITSPTTRMITITVIFAAVHITNAGFAGVTVASAVFQVAVICFRNSETVLHETTGNLIAPIASHMTYNFIAGLFVVIAENKF